MHIAFLNIQGNFDPEQVRGPGWGNAVLFAFPAVQGCTGIFIRAKRLKTYAFGNRVVECRADFGQDGQ